MEITPISNMYSCYRVNKDSGEKHEFKSCNVSTLPSFADAKSLASISFKSLIHYDAMENTWDSIQSDIERRGDDINEKDREGNTPLMVAIEHNYRRKSIVKNMLEQPDIDINWQNKDGCCALDIACKKGYTDIIENLLQYNSIEVNLQNNLCRTPLIDLLNSDKFSTEALAKLLEHPDIDVTVKDYNGRDAFYYANYRSPSAIDMLKNYQRGVDKRQNIVGAFKLPSVDINRLSPEENIWPEEKISERFSELVNRRDFDDAEKMLESTPLINLKGNDNPILIKVCQTGKPNFIRKVFAYQDNQAEMKAAYDAKRKEFLENTIQTLSYEELKNNLIALNTEDNFKILVSKEDFNPNDKVEHNSLFDIACKLDSDGSIVKGILSKYEDIDTKYARKFAPLNIMPLIDEYETKGKYQIKFDNIKRKMANPETKELAVQQIKDFINSEEFSPEITDSLGNTALHLVAAMPADSARGLIQKLVDKGINIDATNITNQTALVSAIKAMRIAQNDNDKTNLLSNIKFLLDKNAEVDIKDNNNQTAFHHACASNSPALLAMVLEKEPNILAKDSLGHRGNFYLSTPKMKEVYESYANN